MIKSGAKNGISSNKRCASNAFELTTTKVVFVVFKRQASEANEKLSKPLAA